MRSIVFIKGFGLIPADYPLRVVLIVILAERSAMERPANSTPILLTHQLKHNTLHSLIDTLLNLAPALSDILIVAEERH